MCRYLIAGNIGYTVIDNIRAPPPILYLAAATLKTFSVLNGVGSGWCFSFSAWPYLSPLSYDVTLYYDELTPPPSTFRDSGRDARAV